MARQQELEHQRNEAIASIPPQIANESPSTEQQEVDAAVQQLQAIVPQYRASIAALQGRVAVLNKQLVKTTGERDEFQIEVTRWKEAAKKNEACFAGAAAKLHSNEAASLAAVTSSQALTARLEGEVSSLRHRCSRVENEAGEARNAAQHAQQVVDSQSKLLESQADTIARLESTIREQQEDIIAALDLVCHRTTCALDPGFSPQHASQEPRATGTRGNKESTTDWENINNNRDIPPSLGNLAQGSGGLFNTTKGVSTTTAAAGGVAAAGAGYSYLQDWSIPAENSNKYRGNLGASHGYNNNNSTALNSSFDVFGSSSAALHEQGFAMNAGGSKRPGTAMGKTSRPSSAAGKSGKGGVRKSGGMAELAADIAALKDALKQVM